MHSSIIEMYVGHNVVLKAKGRNLIGKLVKVLENTAVLYNPRFGNTCITCSIIDEIRIDRQGIDDSSATTEVF